MSKAVSFDLFLNRLELGVALTSSTVSTLKCCP